MGCRSLEFEVKVKTGLVSPEVSLFGLQVATFSLFPPRFFLWFHTDSGVSLYVQILFHHEDTSHWFKDHPVGLI